MRVGSGGILVPDEFPKNPEKRHYKRLDCELDVELKLNESTVFAKTANISCGGMFLPLPSEMMNVQGQLTAKINLPDCDREIKLEGIVTRKGPGDAVGREGVAVKFSTLYNDNVLMIDRFIKNKLLH